MLVKGVPASLNRRAHVDEIFVTGCFRNCQNDDFRCRKIRQYDDLFVTALLCISPRVHVLKAQNRMWNPLVIIVSSEANFNLTISDSVVKTSGALVPHQVWVLEKLAAPSTEEENVNFNKPLNTCDYLPGIRTFCITFTIFKHIYKDNRVYLSP